MGSTPTTRPSCAYALDREGGQTPCTAADVKHPIGAANVKQRDRLLAMCELGTAQFIVAGGQLDTEP